MQSTRKDFSYFFASFLRNTSINVAKSRYSININELENIVLSDLTKGDIIITMGAGDVTNLSTIIYNKLKKRKVTF